MFNAREWCLKRAEARDMLAKEQDRNDCPGAAAEYRKEAECFRAVAERLPQNEAEEALLECRRIIDEVSTPTLGLWTQWFMQCEPKQPQLWNAMMAIVEHFLDPEDCIALRDRLRALVKTPGVVSHAAYQASLNRQEKG